MGSSLQAELKQTKPFSSREQEATLALERTADCLARSFAQLFKAYGLTGKQYNVLRILRGAGEGGLACSEIGERMISRDPDITRLLERMERRGLCVRQRGDQDRRVVVTRITTRGLDLLRQLDAPVDQLHRALVGHVGQRGLRLLLKLLEAVRAGAKTAVPAPQS